MFESRTQHEGNRPLLRLFADLARVSQREQHLDLEEFGGYVCEALDGLAIQSAEDHLQGCEVCAGILESCYEGRSWDVMEAAGASQFFSRQDRGDLQKAARLLVPGRFNLRLDNCSPRAEDIQGILALFGSSCRSVMRVAVERFHELHRDFFDTVNHGLWTLMEAALGPAEAAAIGKGLVPQEVIGHDRAHGSPSLKELMEPVRSGAARICRLVSRENMDLLVAQADTAGVVGGALIRCDGSTLLAVVDSSDIYGPSARVDALKHEILQHWVPLLLRKDL